MRRRRTAGAVTVTPVQQRVDHDCAMAAIASLARVSYERVEAAARQVDPKWSGTRGLYHKEMVEVAAMLGLRLKTTRRFHPKRDEGVLMVKPMTERSTLHEFGHFVVLTEGHIYCPHVNRRLRWHEYVDQFEAWATTLLRLA